MPVRIINTNCSQVGKVVAQKILERLRTPIANLPEVSGNSNHSSPGNPLTSTLPTMRPYPNADMVTGNGFGPLIGREPRHAQ